MNTHAQGVTASGSVVAVGGLASVRRANQRDSTRSRARERIAEMAGRPPQPALPRLPAEVVHTGLSRAARRTMIRRLASLDTSPLTRPVWVTLTLPGRIEGLTAVSTGPEYRKAFNRLLSRWERAWGSAPLVWKIEFTTGRGGRIAPHLHVLATVPEGEAFGEWHCWLARSWTAAVAAPGLDETEAWNWHLHGVWAELVEGNEPARRAARYFAYFKPGGGRHQDMPPPGSLLPGCGLRRVWGIRGMQVSEDEHPLSPAELKWAGRLARRWAKANLPPRRTRRRRGNGRLTHVTRPWPITAKGGWLIVPGGRAVIVADSIAAAAARLAA